jgi:ribosomal protein S18 acetylase RimI-like enzyme
VNTVHEPALPAIRLGTAADAAPAFEVWYAANRARRGGPPSSPVQVARVRANLGADHTFFVVADDPAEGIVGMAMGMQALADDGAGPPMAGRCHVAMVFVAPDHWGRGIGGAVVDAILAEARRRGYREAQLWTHADNVRAQRLYTRRGFRPSGRRKLDDHAEPILHYERDL